MIEKTHARLVVVAAGLAATLATSSARADAQVCPEAALEGQSLRDAHRLVEARDHFRTCAREDCPRVVQRDCVAWLADLERNLPTIVLAAKDASGRDVIAVRVSMDGREVATKLDGQSLALDPGEHAFLFEQSDGTQTTVPALVNEGEKNKVIGAVMGALVARLPDGPTPSPEKGSVLRPLSYVLGGTGVLAAGFGATFGLLAMSEKSRANCSSAGVCAPAPLADARRDATFATIGFVASGLLLANSVTILLVAPRDGGKTVRLSPALGMRSAGLVVGGAW